MSMMSRQTSCSFRPMSQDLKLNLPEARERCSWILVNRKRKLVLVFFKIDIKICMYTKSTGVIAAAENSHPMNFNIGH